MFDTNLSRRFMLCVFTSILITTKAPAFGKESLNLVSLSQLFEQAASSDTVPGINVAVADQSGILWAEGFGWADVENQVAMTPKHKMRIGSVAKLITVAGMMRLKEKGILNLDTPITQYVQSWPKHHQPITLRQLSAHTSGVRHYNSGAEFMLNTHYDSVLASLDLFKDDPLLFSPGSQIKYSTFAFSLIAAAMEGADQKRNFKTITQQEVFTPLDMHDSDFDDPDRLIAFRQRPYFANEGGLMNSPQTDHSYKYAGGGFIATPSDIARFAVAHAKPGYLNKQSLETLFTPAKLDDGTALSFGVGWMIGFDNFKQRNSLKDDSEVQMMMASFSDAVMHSGGSNGGTTMMILCREHQRAVTVVKNVDNDQSANEIRLAVETLYKFHQQK